MPNYVIINPDDRTIELHNVSDYNDAIALANLSQGELDFGSIGFHHDLTFIIVVYEFGLMNPKQSTYFRLGPQLFNGNAVIYAANIEGATVDFPSSIAEYWKDCSKFEWFANANEVEAAIAAGRVRRPQSSINGQVYWTWNTTEAQH